MKRSVRVAMLDSGVVEGHPHLPSVAGGVHLTAEGESADYRDALGHGTAVGALLHYMVPEAELYSVKIFDRRLATSLPVVLRGIAWCLAHGMDIINLSLGTVNEEHRPQFAEAIEEVRRADALLISAYAVEGRAMLPGSMAGVLGVVEDASLDHAGYRVVEDPTPHLAACPYPRDVEGVPREHNLHGVSFAVAHASAFVAARWDGRSDAAAWLEQLKMKQGSVDGLGVSGGR